MIFQILLEPQYLEPLRDEASKALKAHGYLEKFFSTLVQQDSFIREINRVYPTSSSEFPFSQQATKAEQSITLPPQSAVPAPS
jgi:hypothetical protein